MHGLDLSRLQGLAELSTMQSRREPTMAFESEAPGLGISKRGPGDDLRLKALNVETGTQRYPPRADVFPPQTATWRSNLTALSQRRNLLFVAYAHQVYVWEPAGPWQMLGSRPSMIITPRMKKPDAEGYISPDFPHAINNVLVDDLGREEVLLLATDSGNVCGYNVEAIFSALERAEENGEARPFDGSHIEAFFSEWVEASAWGLAIHKFARLIAVSANTGLITVFAFALVDPSSENSSDTDGSLDFGDDLKDYGQNWLNIKNTAQLIQFRRLMQDRYRSRNVRLTYAGHFTNIPSVSFLNCDLDPNGTWMVSTDIDNKLLVWKVWESLGPFNAFHFNDRAVRPFPQTMRNDERGWTVIALDPRTFRLCRSYVEACGGRPYQKMNQRETVLDLTNLSRDIPDASHLYNYFPPSVREALDEPTFPDIFDSDCCVSKRDRAIAPSRDGPEERESMLDENMNDDASNGCEEPEGSNETVIAQAGSIGEQRATGTGQHGLRFTIHAPMNTAQFLQLVLQDALGGDISGTEDNLPEAADYIDDDTLDDYEGGMHDFDSEDNDEDQEMQDDADEDENGNDGNQTGTFAYQLFDNMFRNAFPDDPDPYIYADNSKNPLPGPTPASPNFPILHFSQTDIRLIPHPFAPYPTVVYGGPLRQPFTCSALPSCACDRFNMVKYVPEHGLVVAATQKGRAAIISLTEAHNKGLALRINWIVPLESQEKYGDRPLVALLGMAVSPVQGFEMPPDVPFIPRGAVDEDDIAFHYRFIESDGDTQSMPNSDDNSTPSATGINDSGTSEKLSKSDPKHTDPPDTSPESAQEKRTPLTISESHAIATRTYQPDQPWRGWSPSRRYRLLLMYADHTVMSYEFWYEWSDAVVGEDYDGDRDDYLII
ncbi:hypothetical protein VTN02DRAFT_1027 [Thermoascus thermophilus]